MRATAFAAENRVDNAGFEANAATPLGWSFWTRDADAGRADLDESAKHGGNRSVRITHSGAQDWSFQQEKTVPVEAGDVFALSAWSKRAGAGECGVSVVTRDAKGGVLDWTHAHTAANAAADWTPLTRRFVVPETCTSIQLRITGFGKTVAWFDDLSLIKEGNVRDYERTYAAQKPQMENVSLRISFGEGGALAVEDKRGGARWTQRAFNRDIVIKGVSAENARHVRLDMWDVQSDLALKTDFYLDGDRAELRVTLDAKGTLKGDCAYPQPFVGGASQWLVVPMNEGILYPVSDASIPHMRLIAYGGHGISMPWFGTYDPATGAGAMTILETPDDASIELTRRGDFGLFIRPIWEPSRGEFRYPRAITCVFFEKGGYVAQTQRYREYAKKTGLFKTLEQKKGENPNVDLLVGAANIWNWNMRKAELCKELKAAGVERVLFSASEDTAAIPGIEKLGYLAGRYDLFQDVRPPDRPKWAAHDGWPDDLVLLPNGDWMRGWAHHETKADGTTAVFEGGVVCSSRQLLRAKQRIPDDLKTRPYTARFIDTTTASPWRECYNPAHPLTRSDDRANKMALLEFVSKDCKQVTGTETGIDPSVPFVDYYEGMLSLGPYRLPDAGRDMQTKQAPTAEILKFQTGHFYRAPLWELVYHDCVCAQWYWGDYNNKIPEIWARRDLFNILYATSPMYMFDGAEWARDKKRIIDSAKSVTGVARRFGYQAMIAHSFLTPDHAVQKTEWSGGAAIIVNFGAANFTYTNGVSVNAMSFYIEEPKERK